MSRSVRLSNTPVADVPDAAVPDAAAPDAAAPDEDELRVRRGRRFGGGMLALAVVTGLLVGYAIALVTMGGNDDPPGDTSPEAGFARDMITHHAQAVAMGLIAYDRATLSGVRQVGYDIATAQQAEIGVMSQWLRGWDLLPTGTEPPMAWMPDGEETLVDGRMPGMATQEQMQELREAEGPDVDRRFLELMIYHHLGGIHMAEGVLELSDHPEVTRLAELMKQNQQYELTVLQGLQERLAEQAD